MVESVCRDYRVDLFPCGGFPSLSFCHRAASAFEKSVSIVYIGDYDPAGVIIDGTLEDELAKHTHHDIDFHRLAVNHDQIVSKMRRQDEELAKLP